MDLLRAHADAIITGIHTLVEETLSAPKLNEGRGPVYRIEEESLRELRANLGRKRENGQRQLHAERAAFAGLALDPNSAAH